MPDVEDADDLYRLAPEEFTAARDALARRLRAAKERERADAVKKLRRPSALAWALNQVARSDAGLIAAVLSAGNEVKEALGRGDGAAMRDAEKSMRKASDAVVDAASRVLGDAGHGPTDDARSRLATTLRAALIDADVADRLRAGTLERDVELAGLGLEDVAVAATPPRPSPARSPKREGSDAGKLGSVDRKEEAKREREERRRQEEARRAARARVAELESTAERLAHRAERLAGVADRAEEAAREARLEADEARAEAEEAAERAAAARAELAAGDLATS